MGFRSHQSEASEEIIMIHARLNKLPRLSGRVFLLYLLQLSELLEVLILQLQYDWCLCQDSVTKSFFFTSLLFAVSPMAKNLTVTLSALQVFHGWLKKLCGSDCSLAGSMALFRDGKHPTTKSPYGHGIVFVTCLMAFLVPILGPLSVMWSCFSPFWGSFQQNRDKFL